MAFTTEAIVTLTHMTCPVCGVVYGLNESQRKEFKEHRGGHDGKGSWYCPMGHSVHYPQETEEDRLRAKALRLESQLEFARRQRESAEKEAIVHKGRATRFKNERDRVKRRVSAGLCPCCNRHFTNLERHIGNKHPGFVAPENPEG